jgi:hypothetical protein
VSAPVSRPGVDGGGECEDGSGECEDGGGECVGLVSGESDPGVGMSPWDEKPFVASSEGDDGGSGERVK